MVFPVLCRTETHPAMKSHRVRIAAFLGLCVSFLSGPVMATENAVDGFQSIRITKSAKPIYPWPLRVIGVTTGETAVACAIDIYGQLTDIMPLAYTQIEFYEVAASAIRTWEFAPARSRGNPVPVVQIFTFEFEASRDVVQMTSADSVASWMGHLGDTLDRYRVMKLSELDAIPAPVKVVNPLYPETRVGSGIEGDVVVEFYIDEKGDVRMPAIVEHTHLDFAAVAIDAVLQWKFEPPMHDGRNVTALARQKFHFNPSNEEN